MNKPPYITNIRELHHHFSANMQKRDAVLEHLTGPLHNPPAPHAIAAILQEDSKLLLWTTAQLLQLLAKQEPLQLKIIDIPPSCTNDEAA